MGEVNWKLSYKLKQQTPMIHFQYYQSGATLRASEVKPKLDKFIISKLGKSKCKKEWYIGNTNALNYKMQIVANGEKTVSQHKELTMKGLRKEARAQINGMYFGNQGSKPEDLEKYKETVFYKEQINLNIICFIPELRDVIDKYIAEFFAVTNFGTRQTKGFGGFSLIKDGKEPINENNIIRFLKNNNYLFFYAQNLKKDPMNVAKAIYTSMKTGVNLKGNKVYGYLLYKYLEDNEIDAKTDKALIINELFSENRTNENDKYYFVRALLGLTDNYSFRIGKNKGKTVTVSGAEMDNNGNPVVQRFQSPVTIKILGKTVIFIFNEELFKEICGKKFVFKFEKKQRKIAVPESIDVNKFIDDFVKYHNEQVNDGIILCLPEEI